jgi:glycosyltransferase involved in cell wall biosynthesis
MEPKISVCITTYQRATKLDTTLSSLYEQTRLPDELIISDDCSMDGTREVAEKWAGKFKNFRYNRNEKNLYMPGNLNAAVSMAKGEYIANLHDADVFHPQLIEKWEKALDLYPTAGFVFCGVGSVGEGPAYLHPVEPLTSGREFYVKHMLHRTGSIVWGTVMARREAYGKLLPFDKEYGFVSDVDMWLRMCGAFDVAYVKEILIFLDHSLTKERMWNWKHKDASRRMQEKAIERMFMESPKNVMKKHMSKHQLVYQSHYFRGLLGALKRKDRNSLIEGLTCCRGVGYPLKILSGLVSLFR